MDDTFSLIDVSNSDDDFLFASSSDVSAVDNPNFTEGVPMNQPSNSLDLHRLKKTGKCNLRKSLAWDSAFFTNAGVLDPEELSSIIERAEMGVKQSSFLPGIQEELSQSTDSISTFQSDLTLESLEADLFCDIRASIQRCNKSCTTGNIRDSKSHGEDKSISGTSTKIIDTSPRKLAKPKSASNRFNSGPQGSVRTLKPGPVSKQEKPPINRSREPSSSLSRPAKAAGQLNLQVAATPKRMSVGAGRGKQDTNALGIVKGKGSSLLEAPRQVTSRKLLPKSLALSKISAPSLLLNKTAPHSSRSSCDSSSSSTSENVRKSQSGIVRKKIEKTVNMPSLSKTRTSSKVVDKAKSQNKESRLSAFVKSSSNISPSVSPASSISEWSTESSSSTATVNQKHFGSSSFLSSQDVSTDSIVSRNLHTLSSKRDLGGHDHQVAGVNNQSLKQSSTGSVSNTRPGFAKPSGLRMPSPNIGFFDGVKAGVRTPSSSSRSRTAVPSSLPRSVAGTHSPPGTGSNKTKHGTSASKVPVTGTAKLKQRITDANSKTAALPVDHCSGLKNASSVKHTDNDSETSLEFHLRNPPKSCGDLVAVDVLSKPGLEKYNNIPESSDPGNRVLGKDSLACELVITTTEDPKPDLPSASSKLVEGYLSMSVLEKANEVTEVPDGGEHALEVASMVKDNLVASMKEIWPEENSLITTDMGNSITKYQLEGYPQSSDPNPKLTVVTADNDSGSTRELSKNTLRSCASKATEITDGEKDSIPDFGSVVKEGLPVHDMEELVLSNNDIITFLSEDGSHLSNSADCVEISHAIPNSNIKEKNLNIGDNIHDFTQHSYDADYLESISQHTLQDGGRNVGTCANNENQCVENGLAETKENPYTANYEREIQEESHANVKSLSEKISSLVLNSPLPSSVVDPAAAPPFAIENSDSTGIGQLTLQDELRTVGPCVDDEIQCVENGLAEFKEISNTANYEGEIQEESHIRASYAIENSDSNSIGQLTLQDEVRTVGSCANDENQCVENGLAEIKEISNTANYKGEIQEKSHLRAPFAIENSDSKGIGQLTPQDGVRTVGPYANDENQCVENGLAEIKKISNTANYEREIQEDSHTSVQSLSEKVSGLTLSSPLPSSVVDPAATTPFAIKNSDSNGIGQHTPEYEFRTLGPCVNNENQCVEIGAAEVKENSYTANYEVEIQEESYTSVQSLSEKFSSLILNSPLPSSVVDPAARTPFAIKICDSNVVEMSNSSIG